MLPIEIFIGSVITVLGQTQTKKNNWSFQILRHRHNGSNRSTLTNKRRFFAKRIAHGGAGRVRVWPGSWTQVRPENRLRNNLHISVSFFDEIFGELQNFIGILIRHEPHADFGLRAIGDGRLYARARVAANDAVNFKGRSSPQSACDVGFVTLPHFLQFVGALELLYGKAGSEEIIDFAFREPRDVIIEAGHANLSLARVVAFG